MKILLELNQLEGELVFALLKEFAVERSQTAVMRQPSTPVVTETPENVTEATKFEAMAPPVEVPEKTEEVTETPIETPKQNVITLEEVRAVLTAKKQEGKNVAALIKSYGTNSLPDIDPAHYEEILQRAEAL